MENLVSDLEIPHAITELLTECTNMTVAVCSNDVPWCFNCFYAYHEEQNVLIFKSDDDTKHINIAKRNEVVAGTITPDRLLKGRIRGIQVQGRIMPAPEEYSNQVEKAYYRKYPFAAGVKGRLWVITLIYLKMTDSILGIRKKFYWGSSLTTEI